MRIIWHGRGVGREWKWISKSVYTDRIYIFFFMSSSVSSFSHVNYTETHSDQRYRWHSDVLLLSYINDALHILLLFVVYPPTCNVCIGHIHITYIFDILLIRTEQEYSLLKIKHLHFGFIWRFIGFISGWQKRIANAQKMVLHTHAQTLYSNIYVYVLHTAHVTQLFCVLLSVNYTLDISGA